MSSIWVTASQKNKEQNPARKYYTLREKPSCRWISTAHIVMADTELIESRTIMTAASD